MLILLFMLSTIAYILVSTIACDLASTDAFYWSESHRRSTSDNREYTESDAQRETPDCPDEEVVVSEETAERLADDAMYIYNQYDWAALGEDYVYSFVMECSEILEYNPNAIYTPCILTSPEEIGEEKYREFAARDSMRFVVKQRLSRFYHQVFHSDYEDFDSEDFDTMLWWLKKALLKRKDAIDYNFFAKRVDMLDLAWRELNALGKRTAGTLSLTFTTMQTRKTRICFGENTATTSPIPMYATRSTEIPTINICCFGLIRSGGGVPTTEPAPCGAYSSIKYSTCIRTNFILRKRFAARPAI